MWEREAVDIGHALRRFDDILLQDGSSFAVLDELKDTFPGRFTKVSPAATRCRIADGSGLSRHSRLSAAAMTDLLRWMAQQPQDTARRVCRFH